ncbi:MAG: aminotransferase class V-fold PLP-dependent enzyme [Anaerolineales bacterium]
MNEISRFLVAAVLGCEFGIGVRSGCFCAHPYLMHLLENSPQKAQQVRQNIISGDRTDMPGMVRASLGLYNTGEDIDALVEALQIIDRRDFQGKYFQDNASGEVIPKDWHPDFNSFFLWINDLSF